FNVSPKIGFAFTELFWTIGIRANRATDITGIATARVRSITPIARMKVRRLALWALGFLATATVWFSLTPPEYLKSMPHLLSWDKAQHSLVYFVLAMLARWGSRS